MVSINKNRLLIILFCTTICKTGLAAEFKSGISQGISKSETEQLCRDNAGVLTPIIGGVKCYFTKHGNYLLCYDSTAARCTYCLLKEKKCTVNYARKDVFPALDKL